MRGELLHTTRLMALYVSSKLPSGALRENWCDIQGSVTQQSCATSESKYCYSAFLVGQLRPNGRKHILVRWPCRSVSPATPCVTYYTLCHLLRSVSPTTLCVTCYTLCHQLHSVSPATLCVTCYALCHLLRSVSPATFCVTCYGHWMQLLRLALVALTTPDYTKACVDVPRGVALVLVGLGAGWAWCWLCLVLVGLGAGCAWCWLCLVLVVLGAGCAWCWLGLVLVGCSTRRVE
ncbi:hypothetical protein FHG87_008003 [Trinorchestia longiramus]|nr:hypothetical protein FHG87_008003 [Trinorchestia longiramus]